MLLTRVYNVMIIIYQVHFLKLFCFLKIPFDICLNICCVLVCVHMCARESQVSDPLGAGVTYRQL